MILFNASTGSGLRNRTRYLTRTDSTTYSDSDLDASLNAWNNVFTTEILAAMDDWDFKAETATSDLVANQQEYVMPTDLLKIKRIEVSYDGTNWKYVNWFDINERGEQTHNLTDFTTDEPYADMMDGSVMLYPIPTTSITGGIKIWYSKLDDMLTNATDQPKLAEPFQIGLCYGAAKDYYERNAEKPNFTDRAVMMGKNINDIIEKMKEFYNTHNQERDYVLKPVFQDYNDDMNS
jgi:hypothetical protein